MKGGYLHFRARFNLGLLHRLLRLVHCDFEVRGAALTHLGHACRHLGLMLVQRRLQPGVPQVLLRGCELLLHTQIFRIVLAETSRTLRQYAPQAWTTLEHLAPLQVAPLQVAPLQVCPRNACAQQRVTLSEKANYHVRRV